MAVRKNALFNQDLCHCFLHIIILFSIYPVRWKGLTTPEPGPADVSRKSPQRINYKYQHTTVERMGALNSTEQTRSAVERGRNLDSVGGSPYGVGSQQALELRGFETTLADVLILLANIYNSDIKIPIFLIVDILNYADVLPPVVAERLDNFRSGNNCDITYLNVKLPRSRHVRPSVLRLEARSRDQGWSSYPQDQGTRTSFTWAEISLSNNPTERFGFFRNIHAGKEMERHHQDIPLLGDLPEPYPALRDAIVRATAPAGKVVHHPLVYAPIAPSVDKVSISPHTLAS